MTATRQDDLSRLLTDAELIEIGRPLITGMPSSPNHPGFRMSLLRRHGDMVRPDGSSASNEIIIMGGHVGTHVDALAHVSFEGKMHGDIDASDAQRTGRFTEGGAEQTPPMLTRGLFFDIAKLHGVSRLEGGYGVTADDLRAVLDEAGVEPRAGDVALVRTGWGQLWDEGDRYVGHESGVPGITLDAGEWFVQNGIRAVGVDTTAAEQLLPGAGHSLLPVHVLLLVQNGIYIIEHMALEDLSAADVVEFTFVMAPLAIVGGTGSPIRPLAVVVR